MQMEVRVPPSREDDPDTLGKLLEDLLELRDGLGRLKLVKIINDDDQWSIDPRKGAGTADEGDKCDTVDVGSRRRSVGAGGIADRLADRGQHPEPEPLRIVFTAGDGDRGRCDPVFPLLEPLLQ